jgi:hypothetical protein
VAGDQSTVPAQQRLWPHQEDVPRAARQRAAQRGEQQPVMQLEPRLADLPAQDRQFVPEHENLELLLAITAPEQHDQLQQATDEDVEG